MKKAVTAIVISLVCAACSLSVCADTIYPDPNEVAEELEQEQKRDEAAAQEAAQQQEQAQSAQQQQTPNTNTSTYKKPQYTTPSTQTTTTTTAAEPEKEEEQEKTDEEKTESKSKTDFSQILPDGLTKEVQEDILETLKKQELLAIKISEAGKTLLPKEFNEKLNKLNKTLVVTMYDYTDKADYQYEIRTKTLPAKDVDLLADMSKSKGENATTKYVLPFDKGVFKTWEKANTEYVVNHGDTKEVIETDSKGALTLDLDGTEIAYAQKPAEKHVFWPIFIIIAALAMCAAILKTLMKGKGQKAEQVKAVPEPVKEEPESIPEIEEDEPEDEISEDIEEEPEDEESDEEQDDDSDDLDDSDDDDDNDDSDDDDEDEDDDDEDEDDDDDDESEEEEEEIEEEAEEPDEEKDENDVSDDIDQMYEEMKKRYDK